MRAMPYDKNDPRSQLSTAGASPTGIPRPAQYRELHEVGPDEKHDNGSNTWWTRSQAMVIGWTEAQPNDELTTDVAGEHGVLVLDGATLDVSTMARSSRSTSLPSSSCRRVLRACESPRPGR